MHYHLNKITGHELFAIFGKLIEVYKKKEYPFNGLSLCSDYTKVYANFLPIGRERDFKEIVRIH